MTVSRCYALASIMNQTNRFINLETLALFVLFLGHGIAAYTSYGFHHPDEHFQILEWAAYFVGIVPDSAHLPWEFAAQIRPWFQPMLHAGFLKLFVGLGIYNPFDAAFFFRLAYSFLNIFSLVALWKYFKERYTLNPAWLLWTSLIWFFPYIHVRTSSENLAGILLSFALLAILKNKKYFFSGILFGFAFLARYQIALGLAGLGVALIVKERKIIREHWKLLAGFILPVILGVLIDRIGYGNWVFTAYRYFKVNLVDGVAATFNPYPWYQYFIWVLQLNPFVSLPLFAGAVLFCTRAKRDDRLIIGSFVWAFFILHCFITNKEYRFLFPILNLIPFMTMVAFQSFEPKLTQKRYLLPYALMSLIAFMVSSLHGASLNMLGTVTLVDRHTFPNAVWLSNRAYRNLGAYEQFYSQGAPPPLVFASGKELADLLNQHPSAMVAIDGRIDDSVTLDMLQTVEGRECELIDSTVPRKIYDYKARLPFLNKLPYVAIYRCHEK
jgi:hypothetical protein